MGLPLLIVLSLTLGCQKERQKSDQPAAIPSAPKIETSQESPSAEGTVEPIFFKPEVIAHVRKSPIGQLFESYISSPDGLDRNSHVLAEAISQRVFSEPSLMVPRIDALRVLVEDLYSRHMGHNEAAQSKIQLLHFTLERDRLASDSYTTRLPSFHQVLPYLVGVSILSGSNELKQQLWLVSQRVFRYLIRTEAKPLPPFSPKRLFGRSFFHQYSIGSAYRMFMHSAMAYMILEQVAGTHGEGEMSTHIPEHMADHLLEINDL